jgi:predicted DNA-binding ribbon-helix-helix protein
MQRVLIWKEWYEILEKIANDNKISINLLISNIVKTNECLNLPEVKVSSKKSINVNIDDKDILEKIHKYLFCD